MRALEGIKVVEFGDGVAVGYCGALLRSCGSSVIKIESPKNGDSVRHLPPFAEGIGSPEASGFHAFLNAGKSSVAIDLEETGGATLARKLCLDADVVLEALGPETANSIGIGYKVLKADSPSLVMVSLSWFGADGPRRNWVGNDAIVQALAGFIYPIGTKEGPPIIPGGYQAQITGGLTAFVATMTAMIGVLTHNEGVLIDQSILEAQATYSESAGVRYAYDGTPSVRKGLNKFQPTYPQTIYPTAEGWIGVNALTPPQWRACCELLGATSLCEEPRFLTSETRNKYAEELDACLIPLFRKRAAVEWFHEAQAKRVPFALVPTMEELESLDHFEARNVMVEYNHSDLGKFSAAAIPWKFGATPLQNGGTAPSLGQHTRDILTEVLDLSDTEINELVSSGIVTMQEEVR